MSSPLTPNDPRYSSGVPDPLDQARSLLHSVSKGVFWVVIVRGVLAVVLGVLLIAAPAPMAAAIGILIGAWLVVDGVLTILNANTARKSGLPWGWELAAGIAYVLAGLIIAIAPVSFAVISGVFILWMMVIGTLVRGIFSLASASFKGWSKVLGVIDIIFAIVMAVVLFSSPGAALMALVWIIGIYTIVFGAFLIIMAIMARKQARRSLR